MQQTSRITVGVGVAIIVVGFVGIGCHSDRLFYPSSSAQLAGTWIGSANGITVTLNLGIAPCSTTDATCFMRSPASYRLDATGASGRFAVDLLWFDAGFSKTIIMNFLSDTTVVAVGYREQFVGSLVGATTLAGAIGPPLDQHVQSGLDALLSSSISFTRQ
jgi:hypothetical protein